MKTLTICGSMRFESEMRAAAFVLETWHGYNVLQCIYGTGRPLSDAERDILAAAHYRKIDLSDGIYVLDVGGYIGDSVGAEIAYAREKGKEIMYHSEFIK